MSHACRDKIKACSFLFYTNNAARRRSRPSLPLLPWLLGLHARARLHLLGVHLLLPLLGPGHGHAATRAELPVLRGDLAHRHAHPLEVVHLRRVLRHERLLGGAEVRLLLPLGLLLLLGVRLLGVLGVLLVLRLCVRLRGYLALHELVQLLLLGQLWLLARLLLLWRLLLLHLHLWHAALLGRDVRRHWRAPCERLGGGDKRAPVALGGSGSGLDGLHLCGGHWAPGRSSGRARGLLLGKALLLGGRIHVREGLVWVVLRLLLLLLLLGLLLGLLGLRMGLLRLLWLLLARDATLARCHVLCDWSLASRGILGGNELVHMRRIRAREQCLLLWLLLWLLLLVLLLLEGLLLLDLRRRRWLHARLSGCDLHRVCGRVWDDRRGALIRRRRRAARVRNGIRARRRRGLGGHGCGGALCGLRRIVLHVRWDCEGGSGGRNGRRCDRCPGVIRRRRRFGFLLRCLLDVGDGGWGGGIHGNG